MTGERSHDILGNKLPVTFKMEPGKFARKSHDPKGDEVRVTVTDERLPGNLLRHTFENLNAAKPFMNAANHDPYSGKTVKLEFGDGTSMALRPGKTYN